MSPRPSHEPRIVGPFRLERLLGRGGMGEVYRAWDPRLDRWVAMKHVLGEHRAGTARQRFLGEARNLARLGHPAIVHIFDLLEDQGELWIVMELVHGPTLAKLLRRHGPLDVSLVLRYSLQIASALATAHEAGIIHRDLKTDNVMVCRHPAGPAADQVKVLDFGVARQLALLRPETATLATDAETRSLPPALLGTPKAMSPEQARGEEVGARSDLFSLGALIYELLTASSPFRAGSVAETLIRVMTHRQAPAHKISPEVPRTLSDLVDRLLEKAPERRPESAVAVIQALRQVPKGSSAWRRRIWRWGRRKCASKTSADVETPEPIETTPATLSPLHDEAVKTLLASELLGAENMLVKHGDREAAAIFQLHDRQMRRLLAQHGGLELEKSATLLLLFDRPLPAVLFALDYHDALRQLTDETGVDCQARLGIHLGEVVLRRNSPSDVARGARLLEVEGLAKMTARGLLTLAGSGQTLLTRPAYEMAKRSSVGRSNLFEWVSRGRRRKGLAEPVEIFEVRAPNPADRLALAPMTATRTERARPHNHATSSSPGA